MLSSLNVEGDVQEDSKNFLTSSESNAGYQIMMDDEIYQLNMPQCSYDEDSSSMEENSDEENNDPDQRKTVSHLTATDMLEKCIQRLKEEPEVTVKAVAR